MPRCCSHVMEWPRWDGTTSPSVAVVAGGPNAEWRCEVRQNQVFALSEDWARGSDDLRTLPDAWPAPATCSRPTGIPYLEFEWRNHTPIRFAANPFLIQTSVENASSAVIRHSWAPERPPELAPRRARRTNCENARNPDTLPLWVATANCRWFVAIS